jgi:CheY-like chemotaxis protein
VDVRLASQVAAGLKRPTTSEASRLQPTKLVVIGRPEDSASVGARYGPLITRPIRPSQLHDTLVQELLGAPSRTPAAPRLGSLPKQLPRSGARVLVAEDSNINQLVTLGMLAKLGLEADVVANGIQALEAVEHTRYAAVLMDCQMPEMDGFEATSQIRLRQGGRPHLPIIAMTANALVGDRERCLAAGMDDYVSKPVRLEDLSDALVRCIGPRQAFGDRTRPDITRGQGEDEMDPFDHTALEELPATLRDNLLDILSTEIGSRLEQIQSAVSSADVAALRTAAHALKGDAGTVGLRQVAELCRQLERCSEAAEPADWSKPLARLETAVERGRTAIARVRLSEAA